MIPLSYQVVGEEDYAFQIRIEASGDYHVDSGSYTSQPPRSGALTPQQQEQLLAAIEDLGLPRDHPLPEGSAAFMALLTVGEQGEGAASYSFWEGALEKDPKLNRLVRLLELV